MKYGHYEFRLAGLIRESTFGQAKSFSPAAQLAEILKRAESLNAIVCVYHEVGSAGSGKCRPLFEEMMNAAIGPEIDGLITWTLDRFARRPSEGFVWFEKLQENKKHLISIKEDNIDTTTMGGEFMLGVLLLFARYEYQRICERITLGNTQKRAQGLRVGPSRYGLRVIKKSKGQWEAIPEHALAIRRLLELHAQGKGVREIARTLNREGFQTFQKKAWRHGQVLRRLKENEHATT